jgi:hypothetical protein
MVKSFRKKLKIKKVIFGQIIAKIDFFSKQKPVTRFFVFFLVKKEFFS